MDLTLTDASWHDVGLVVPSGGDFAWGADENDFSIGLDGDVLPELGALLYCEGTDVGGMVTGYESDSGSGTLTVVGDTWTGVMGRKVLGPDRGSAYWSVSGDARDCVAALVSRLDLDGLFDVDGRKTGVEVRHTFSGTTDAAQGSTGRYMSGWAALWQLLVGNGLKVRLRWDAAARRVRVEVLRRSDWTDAEAVGVGVASMRVSRRTPTNHLVCLGSGELADREVVDLYADRAGNVSTSQSLNGIDEVAEVYEDSSKSGDELSADGAKRLRRLWADSQTVRVSALSSVSLDLGDVIGGTDARTGVSATAVVTKKVARLDGGALSYEYESTVRS